MTVRNLDGLFRPSSIALVGASERPGSLGCLLYENLHRGGFDGRIYPVNPTRREVFGRRCWPDIATLPEAPDLAVIATPPRSIPATVAALARRGTRAAVVISAGFSGVDGRGLREEMLAAARAATLRVVGPNCLGLLVPGCGLNASFAHLQPAPGGIALVAQSGALITAILDWAAPRGIGFSALVSLGDMADVDFGDLLDFFADDAGTSAILLYVEAITEARKFMSAARAAARAKPVIVVKGGRQAAGARAAASHTGALAGTDAVYDAAFRRAGMLRVMTLEELFDAAETLALARIPNGSRLLILTNGGGFGVLATDMLIESGGTLAALCDGALAQLDAVLPSTWSRANPVDIIGDATPQRYAAAVRTLVAESAADADGLLILNCPTAISPPEEAAAAVIDALPAAPALTVMTCWVGDHSVQAARRRFLARRIPTYATPEDAVRAFMHLAEYRRNQAALLETPPAMPLQVQPDRARAGAIINDALYAGREWLSEIDAKELLVAYQIPVARTLFAPTAAAAGCAAATLGGRLVLKIVSADIVHKRDVGGVVLDIAPGDVERAADAMLRQIQTARPTAQVQGFAVEQMIAPARAVELIAGVVEDHQFGPVVVFGHGGTAVEIIDDKVIALPPLNLRLAADAIARTRIARQFESYRGLPPIEAAAVAETLVKLSQLVIDWPSVVELDVNPLLATDTGVIALDARVRLRAGATGGSERLAIRPYPRELESSVQSDDGRELLLRPIRPEDAAALVRTFARLTPAAIRERFFASRAAVDHITAARCSQIDYDRQMTLVLTGIGTHGGDEIHGVVCLVEEPDRERAEFAILVEDRFSGHGLGGLLMLRMIEYARARRIGSLHGVVARGNQKLLRLCRDLHFVIAAPGAADDGIRVTLALSD